MKESLYYCVSYVKPTQDVTLVDYHVASFLNSTKTETYTVLTNHDLKIRDPRINHIRIDDTFTETWDIKSAKCKIERWINIDDYDGIFQFDWDIVFQNDLSTRFPLIQKEGYILTSVCGNNRSSVPNVIKGMRLCSSVFHFPVAHYDTFRIWTDMIQRKKTQEESLMNRVLTKHKDKVRCLPKYAWYANMSGMVAFDFLHFGLDRKKYIKEYYTKRWGKLPNT